jgi:hypothetical protein
MLDAGKVKVFRYQPVPPFRYPPPAPAGEFWVKACEMLQSCGTSKEVQDESSKVVACAPDTSPRWNFQAASKLTVVDRAPS